MMSRSGGIKGVLVNRRNALDHATHVYNIMLQLKADGFDTYATIVAELQRRGYRGRRGGRLTRERLYEIRRRFRKP